MYDKRARCQMNVTKQYSPSIVFLPGELCITEGETEYFKSDVDIDGLNQVIVGLNSFMPNHYLMENRGVMRIESNIKMKFFAETIDGSKFLTFFFCRRLHLDVWLGLNASQFNLFSRCFPIPQKRERSN